MISPADDARTGRQRQAEQAVAVADLKRDDRHGSRTHLVWTDDKVDDGSGRGTYYPYPGSGSAAAYYPSRIAYTSSDMTPGHAVSLHHVDTSRVLFLNVGRSRIPVHTYVLVHEIEGGGLVTRYDA